MKLMRSAGLSVFPLLLVVAVIVGGCTSMNTQIEAPKNNKFLSSYQGKSTDREEIALNHVINLNTHNTGKSVPLILPPEIRPLWIVDHVNSKGDLVRGHWVFIKIRNSMWYIQAVTRKDFKDIIREMTGESR